MNERIRGFAFPFRIGAAGGVAQAEGDEKLKENIAHILLTGVGERVMRRDYGGGLRQLLHDPNNDALRAIVQHQVAKAVGRLEQRVLLQRLDVAQGQGLSPSVDGEALSISVQYIIRRTRQVQSLSVPVGLGGL